MLVNKNKLNTENNYYLLAKKLIDLNGNIYVNEISSFVVSDKPDTTVLAIVSTNPNRNGSTDFINPEILLSFDDAIDSKEIKNAIQFTDTSKNKIDFNYHFVDDATISIIPNKELKPDKNYEIKIDLNYLSDAGGNKVDSTLYPKISDHNGC